MGNQKQKENIMTLYKSSAVTLEISDGAIPSPQYAALGSVEITRLQTERETLPVAGPASGRWEQLHEQGGALSVLLSLRGIHSDDAAEDILSGHIFAGTAADCRFTYPNGATLSGRFLIASYLAQANGENILRYEMTLRGSDAITYSPA